MQFLHVKICKKILHGNEKMSLPWAFKKCTRSLYLTLLSLKLSTISFCVLFRWPMQELLKRNSRSTTRNFSKGDLVQAKFSELKQHCSYSQSLYNSQFWHLYNFLKTATKNCNFFIFQKSRYFRLGGRRKTNLGAFW